MFQSIFMEAFQAPNEAFSVYLLHIVFIPLLSGFPERVPNLRALLGLPARSQENDDQVQSQVQGQETEAADADFVTQDRVWDVVSKGKHVVSHEHD